jgi:hypothetical protein
LCQGHGELPNLLTHPLDGVVCKFQALAYRAPQID